MRLPLVWRPAPSARHGGSGATVGGLPAGRPGRPGPDVLRHRRDRPARVDAGRPAAGRRRRRRVPGLRQGPDRVGQRTVRHRRPPPHHDARPVGGDRLPPRDQPRRDRGRALRPGRRPARSRSTGGTTPTTARSSATTWWPICGTPSPRSGPTGWSSKRRCEPDPGGRRYWTGPVAGRGRRPVAGWACRPTPVPCPSSSGPAPRSTSLSRTDPLVTMVVTRDPGEVYLLRTRHGSRTSPARSSGSTPTPWSRWPTPVRLAGGPMWPGGLAAHANGSLYVVFGNHAHRLDARPRDPGHGRSSPGDRPYNSFVILPDGTLVTKDFAGSLPGAPVAPDDRVPCELVALEPEGLAVIDRIELPEPSIARISARRRPTSTWWATPACCGSGGTVGSWPTPGSAPPTGRRRARPTAGTACWPWVRHGSSTTATARPTSTARSAGKGVSTAPLQLIRVDLSTGGVGATEICGSPGGPHHQSPHDRRGPSDRRRLRQRQRRHGRLRHRVPTVG